LLSRAESIYPNNPRQAARVVEDGQVDKPPGRRDGPTDWAGLGIFAARAYPDGRPGHVTLVSAPFAGFGLGTDVVADWVQEVLTREADVGAKLAAAALGTEGHAFIWATISSAVPVHTALDLDLAGRMPSRDPVLPAGVTLVWVASPYTSARSLAWFPKGGWRELPFRWSRHGNIKLSQPS
jgi:hypothetical protein